MSKVHIFHTNDMHSRFN